MAVGPDRVVVFDYVLTDEQGEELERSSEEPMVYLHGANNIIRGLEEALVGHAKDDEVQVILPPERAYGLRRDDAIQRVPIKHLLTKAKKFDPGQVVAVNTQQGQKSAIVVKAGRFNVDLDMNHPFAGKTVTFDVTIRDIRDATADELSHGHAHGIDGQHHHH